MIVKIVGKLVEKKDQSLIINIHGLCYEVIVPTSVSLRIEDTLDSNGDVHLKTYHYMQMTPTSAMPLLVGFISEIERDFFIRFIKVSGIGPRAAVKALNQPISEITRAIDEGDINFLKTLPGIGMQRAKEIVAKLQGKIGKYGLIQDKFDTRGSKKLKPDWQEEALTILLQLQYKKHEAQNMIEKVIDRDKDVHSAEDLLNEIYRQKVKK